MLVLLEEYRLIFERLLATKLHSLAGAEEPVGSGMKYALNGGKRLRPILAMLGAEFMGGSCEQVIDIACGMECIHNYSLVHDDLPSMDNDNYRHGQLTTHKKFGEGMGVLIGDSLLNIAYEWMLNGGKGDDKYYRAISYIARQAGVFGMIGGQCIDIKDASLRTKSIEEIIQLNDLKTSALLRASLVGGAIACGANSQEIIDLEIFASNLGQSFQLVDDILDTTSTMQELGKDINSDAENNKITYLSLYGLDVTKQYIDTLTSEAIGVLSRYGKRADKLIALCQYLVNRSK